jgi:hypothetical protein
MPPAPGAEGRLAMSRSIRMLKTRKGVRAVGSLCKQRGRNGRAGRIWWIKYYRNGKPIRESTGTAKETEARRILKEREGRVAAGRPLLPHVDRLRYEEIARDMRAHYQTRGSRDLADAEARIARLNPSSGGRGLAAIGPADMTRGRLQVDREGDPEGEPISPQDGARLGRNRPLHE